MFHTKDIQAPQPTKLKWEYHWKEDVKKQKNIKKIKKTTTTNFQVTSPKMKPKPKH